MFNLNYIQSTNFLYMVSELMIKVQGLNEVILQLISFWFWFEYFF